jgi:hypothetical protein
MTPKTEPLCQEMHLKTPRSSIGLKLSNPEPGRREAALVFETDAPN